MARDKADANSLVSCAEPLRELGNRYLFVEIEAYDFLPIGWAEHLGWSVSPDFKVNNGTDA